MKFEMVFILRKTMVTFKVEINIFNIMIWPQAYGSQGEDCGGVNEKSCPQVHASEYLGGLNEKGPPYLKL